MTTILFKITGTKNLLINIITSIALSFIIFTLSALLLAMAFNPSLIESASFGGF